MKETDLNISERERQILQFIAEGKTSPQIAELLCLSPETIKWYRKRMLAKFRAETSAEMVRLAIENKII